MKTPPRPPVAVFAAIDGGGGAGALADCRALLANGCLPLAITTAVTAQNLDGVAACWPLPPAQVRAQFAACRGMPLAAVKVGVVGRAAAAIAALLQHSAAPVVWDPVLAPTAGAAFVPAAAVDNVRRTLLARAHVITPNRRELLQLGAARRVAAAAAAVFAAGCRAALVTDVDGRGACVRHVLLTPASKLPLWEATTPRRRAVYHGSGCLFSSTLAARLARGDTLAAAAAAAHAGVCRAMDASISVPALGRQRLLLD